MDVVRLGVIGCGIMGCGHMGYFDKIEGLEFTAAADEDTQVIAKVGKEHSVATFDNGQALIDSGKVDAVLIATPHYFHPPLAIAALEAGLHALVEKPVGVTAKDAQAMNEVAEAHPELKFAAMFQQRTQANWRFVKKTMDEGRLGEMMRVSWTITDWYRSQTYYDLGSWRATWGGEGGGVLLNQCPHNLDLLQWFTGMPTRVTANIGLGKYHDIEVEDEVLALLEYENGAVGTFITSTGEAPGINRLEIVGDKGTLIASGGGTIELLENEVSAVGFRPPKNRAFGRPVVTHSTVKPGGQESGHRGITENFINSIRGDEELIASGTEGIRSLELSNAMMLSGLENRPVSLPMDRDAYARKLEQLVAEAQPAAAAS